MRFNADKACVEIQLAFLGWSCSHIEDEIVVYDNNFETRVRGFTWTDVADQLGPILNERDAALAAIEGERPQGAAIAKARGEG